MAWNTDRNKKNPPGWARLRKKILERDQRICHICNEPGADAVDHLIPLSEGGTHDEANLAAVHDEVWPRCHKKKTSAEANRARARMPKAKRPVEKHPGLR